MGGDIKIVKKEGHGTLLRFYLLFGQPHDSELPDTPRVSLLAELDNANVRILGSIFSSLVKFVYQQLVMCQVLLAVKGDTARGTLAQWMLLRDLNVYEASNRDETIQALNDLLADEQTEREY